MNSNILIPYKVHNCHCDINAELIIVRKLSEILDEFQIYRNARCKIFIIFINRERK